MKITILTLFPEMFVGPFSQSILKRAQENKLLEIEYSNIRDFGIGKHKIVDDTPYGGGAGMVMRVDVVYNALEKARCKTACNEQTILLDAGGRTFTQSVAKTFSTYDHLIFICGHYEGIDARIWEEVDSIISISDYVLTGGEIPTMVIIDSVVRLIPGVLGKNESHENESFSQTETQQTLEHPHYTRPVAFSGKKVPDILLSGNHAEIAKWRDGESLKRTKTIRPDLLKK